MKWFVIKENEHIGPYSEEDIKNLYAQGKLKNVSFLWREGMDEPRSYKSLFIDVQVEEIDDDVPPPLPPEVTTSKVEPEQEEDLPPPEPVALKTPTSSEEAEALEESEVEMDPPEHEIPTYVVTQSEEGGKKSRSLKKVLIIALIVLVTGAASFYFLQASSSKSFARPSKMGVRDFKRLMKGLAFDKITAAISKDKTSIFVSVPQKLQGPVELKIRSFDGQVLSVDPIKANSTSMLSNHIVEFKEFNFDEGQRLVEGWYEFDLQSLGELESPFTLFGEEESKQISFRTKALLTTKTVSDFGKALENFNEKNSDNSRQFWEELIQKYETMKAMALKIESDMRPIFESDASSWNASIDAFEASYTNNHGKLFTAFVIQNEKAYEDLKQQDFEDSVEVIANYTRLTKLAKSVGLETMNALDILREVKDPSNGAARVEAENKIKVLYENIHNTIAKSVEELESRI